MVGQEDAAVRIEGLSKDRQDQKMDKIKRWTRSKDGYDQKMDMIKRWISSKDGQGRKMDQTDMFERWI
jgi:hypothetical protein